MLIKCKENEHKFVKSGTHMYRDGIHQIFRCTICMTMKKGELIEEEKRALPAKNNAQISNQAPVKENDLNE